MYIGMGANLPGSAGAPEATLAAALERLGQLGRVTGRSSLYSTAPVGIAAQPRFVNAVVALETELPPLQLLDALLEVERAFGRDRASEPANGPRTLDLDILLYGDLCIDEPHLAIPHPRMAERAFVLVPLNEIAPRAVDPRSGSTVGELLRRHVPGPQGEIDAVAPMQSEAWRPGAGCGSGLHDDSTVVRVSTSARHDYGRG